MSWFEHTRDALGGRTKAIQGLSAAGNDASSSWTSHEATSGLPKKPPERLDGALGSQLNVPSEYCTLALSSIDNPLGKSKSDPLAWDPRGAARGHRSVWCKWRIPVGARGCRSDFRTGGRGRASTPSSSRSPLPNTTGQSSSLHTHRLGHFVLIRRKSKKSVVPRAEPRRRFGGHCAAPRDLVLRGRKPLASMACGCRGRLVPLSRSAATRVGSLPGVRQRTRVRPVMEAKRTDLDLRKNVSYEAHCWKGSSPPPIRTRIRTGCCTLQESDGPCTLGVWCPNSSNEVTYSHNAVTTSYRTCFEFGEDHLRGWLAGFGPLACQHTHTKRAMCVSAGESVRNWCKWAAEVCEGSARVAHGYVLKRRTHTFAHLLGVWLHHWSDKR